MEVGDRVEIIAPVPYQGRCGKVISIQDPPRKLTGGRGIAVLLDGDSYSDGWDEEDLQVIWKANPSSYMSC